MRRTLFLVPLLLIPSAGALADDTLGSYHACLQDFETLKTGHVVDGGPHEIRQSVNFSKGSGLGNLSGGLTTFVDRNGDGKSIYFLSDTHAYRVRTDFTPRKSPKFLRVKSPVNGKPIFVRASGSSSGGANASYGVNSAANPLDENTDTPGPKAPPAADLEQLGESEAASILDRQIGSLLADLPKAYDALLSDLKARVTISPTDNHGNNDYGNYFRGSDRENAAFQSKLKTEYGKMLRADYLPALLPSCAKLTSPAVKSALGSALTAGETIRAAYAGPNGKPAGSPPGGGTKKAVGSH